MRTRAPDFVYTVRIYVDPGLTDAGWERFTDALDTVTPEDVLYEALSGALAKALPRPDRDHDGPDWCEITTKEEAFGAVLCPNPAHHLTPAIKSAVAGIPEPTGGVQP